MPGWSPQQRNAAPPTNVEATTAAHIIPPPAQVEASAPPVVVVPQPPQPAAAARKFSWRTKILLGVGGALALALVFFMAYCQSKKPATVSIPPAKTSATPPQNVTPEQINILSQPTPGLAPGAVTGATPGASAPPGLNPSLAGADPSIFIQVPTVPDANQPVTQPAASPGAAPGPNGLSGTVTGGSHAGDADTGTGLANVLGSGESGTSGASGTTGRSGGASSNSSSNGIFGGAGSKPAARPPAVVPASAPAGQSSYYFFNPARVTQAVPPVVPVSLGPAPTPAIGPPASVRPTLSGPVRPPFGAVLPLQTLGALDSLRPNSLARLVLTRQVRGAGYVLPRGTVFVGRVTGSQANRLYLDVLGYLDAARNRVVRLTGEVSGTDGAAGVRGERKTVGSRWRRVAQYLAERGQETFKAWLAGRNGGNTTNIQLPATGELGIPPNAGRVEYVRLAPGAFAYLTVTDLPPAEAAELAPLPPHDDGPGPLGISPDVSVTRALPGLSGPPASQSYLSSGQIIQLLSTGTPEQIRAALPQMPPDVRRVVEADLAGTP